MMWLYILDAFCIGIFLGALIVYLDVQRIARRAAIDKIKEALGKWAHSKGGES